MMKIYFAPMEGLTGYRYRNLHHAFYGKHIDKYFTPFLSPTAEKCFINREINDILPENNKGLKIVPQILANKAALFIKAAKALESYGYREINLNLGCPAKTVVSKGRGSGFLAYPASLEHFLEEIFDKAGSSLDISVKTRLGKVSPDEFYELIEIFNKYPLKELIIHPRVQTDFYQNTPNWDVFRDALSLSKNPVCYNGDIFSRESYMQFAESFPEVSTIMLGRGLLKNPKLAGEIQGEAPLSFEEFEHFYQALYSMYRTEMSGDKHMLFKMKEHWYYMDGLFVNAEKFSKKIRRAQRRSDYEAAVQALFAQKNLFKGRGLL